MAEPLMSMAPPAAQPPPVAGGYMDPNPPQPARAPLMQLPPQSAPQQGPGMDPNYAQALQLATRRSYTAPVNEATEANKIRSPESVSVTTENASPVSPQEVEALQLAGAMDREAVRLRTRAELEQTANAVLAARAERPMLEARAAEAAQYQQTVEDRVTEQQAKLTQMQDELQQARINPQGLFDGPHGTHNRIVAMLATGLGGIGNMLSGGKLGNPAFDAIERAIDRDVAAQEKNYAIKRDNANNAYAQLVRTFGDRQEAKLALTALQTQVAANKAGELAAVSKIPHIQAAAMQAQAELTRKYMEAAQKLQDRARGNVKVSESAKFVRPQAGGYGAPIIDFEKAGKIADFLDRSQGNPTASERADIRKVEARYDAEAKRGRETREIRRNGEFIGYAAGTEARADKIQDAVDSGENILSKVDRAIAILRENPAAARHPGTQAYRDLSSLRLETMLDFKGDAFARLGVLAGPDMEILQGVIPTGRGLFEVDQLQRFRDRLAGTIDTKLRNNVKSPTTDEAQDARPSAIAPKVQGAQRIE